MTITYRASEQTYPTKRCKIIKRYPNYTLVKIYGAIGSYNKCFSNWDISKGLVKIR